MKISRRHFLRSSAAFGAFTILPSHIALGNQSKSETLAPSERVNLALIGAGGKGGRNRQAMLNTGLCNIVAICDVDLKSERLQASIEAHPNAPRFTDFRQMFDQVSDQIDAVMISTPDHAHFAAAMLAMSLGKHVWVEKPLAHTFGQCTRLMDLAQRSGVVTQMGNQGHSGANYFQFKAWTEAGIIKDVTKITAHMNKYRRWHGWGTETSAYPSEPLPEGMDWDTWLNPSPVNPYSKKLHPGNWRCWFDYGSGAFGDWGPHILDTCHRFLKLGMPEKITAVKREGPNDFVFPQESTIQFDFPEREGMPACEVTWYDGQNNKPTIDPKYGDLVTDKSTGKTSREPIELKAPGKIIYSKDLVFQGDSHSSVLQVIPKEKYMDIRRTLPRFSQKNSDHWANFLLACKGEEESRSPFSVSAPLTQVFNLGVLAQRLGGEIVFDRKTEKVTNNKRANDLLDPTPRKGWEEFYAL